jgi:hypothetical protein
MRVSGARGTRLKGRAGMMLGNTRTAIKGLPEPFDWIFLKSSIS